MEAAGSAAVARAVEVKTTLWQRRRAVSRARAVEARARAAAEVGGGTGQCPEEEAGARAVEARARAVEARAVEARARAVEARAGARVLEEAAARVAPPA